MSSTGAAIQVGEFVRALALSWKNLAAYPVDQVQVVPTRRSSPIHRAPSEASNSC
jgi:hypothetical protein